jgi:hypothetical protein
MMSFAKLVPTKDWYIVQKEDFSITLDERPSVLVFVRDTPIFSLERTMTARVQLKKKVSGRVPQGA